MDTETRSNTRCQGHTGPEAVVSRVRSLITLQDIGHFSQFVKDEADQAGGDAGDHIYYLVATELSLVTTVWQQRSGTMTAKPMGCQSRETERRADDAAFAMRPLTVTDGASIPVTV